LFWSKFKDISIVTHQDQPDLFSNCDKQARMKSKGHSKHSRSCASENIKDAGGKDKQAKPYARKQRLYSQK